MAIQGFTVGSMGNNTFVVFDEDAKIALVIDPSMESDSVLDWIREQSLTVKYVVNTHGHQDHTYNNAHFVQETGAELLIHPGDESMLGPGQGRWMGGEPSPPPSGFLVEGEDLVIGSLRVKVLSTPGHTPGSACFYDEDWVATGDTLFAGSIGRFDFPGGSAEELDSSIKNKLWVMSEDTIILPGHGSQSSVARELATNPFVGTNAPPVSVWGKQ